MNFLKWIKRTSIACALFSAAIAAHAAPTLWVSTGGAGLATVDVATGATSFIGNTSVALTDIAFNPSGDLYGISFSSLYKVNSSTGATTLVGSFGSVVGTANALVFGSDGTLYMAGSSLYTVNTLTGAASAIGSIGYQSGGGLAFLGSEVYMGSRVNELIDDLVHPTSETARVIGAVAQGNLSQKMAEEIGDRKLKGQFLTTASTINRMVEQLGSFAAEVTRVAREVGT